ncbi:hypothetical protein ECANGB1_2638 [Enterospora canceri]|uniref:Secreted protein n=1 Tax=Enterospora canceri TaxID=1081671 RepID=A0A1Y1S8W0_9MICR|nr:hypothetical protein ECANGB1_2638 [Enterospora canceri]
MFQLIYFCSLVFSAIKSERSTPAGSEQNYEAIRSPKTTHFHEKCSCSRRLFYNYFLCCFGIQCSGCLTRSFLSRQRHQSNPDLSGGQVTPEISLGPLELHSDDSN